VRLYSSMKPYIALGDRNQHSMIVMMHDDDYDGV
jgi:hypothetical protein